MSGSRGNHLIHSRVRRGDPAPAQGSLQRAHGWKRRRALSRGQRTLALALGALAGHPGNLLRVVVKRPGGALFGEVASARAAAAAAAIAVAAWRQTRVRVAPAIAASIRARICATSSWTSRPRRRAARSASWKRGAYVAGRALGRGGGASPRVRVQAQSRVRAQAQAQQRRRRRRLWLWLWCWRPCGRAAGRESRVPTCARALRGGAVQVFSAATVRAATAAAIAGTRRARRRTRRWRRQRARGRRGCSRGRRRRSRRPTTA